MSSWDNFSLEEFACKHTGKNNISHELIDKLQLLRNKVGFPIVINSGYRSKEHPIEAAKEKPGIHAEGLAVDVKVGGAEAYEVVGYALECGFTGIGVRQKGGYATRFIHLDIAKNSYDRPRPHIWSY
tara:strand:- start:7075 stop:7455 length:381 start_codon:yes stop_codon:yes gene_type:complete